MSIHDFTELRKKAVLTPRGLAHVVWAGTVYGLDIVRVRFLDTGSPWTFERRQVTVL